VKALLGLAALLGLSYVIADKDLLREERERLKPPARRVAGFAVALGIFVFVIYPYLWGDGKPFN
jgi:hypothetical protein